MQTPYARLRAAIGGGAPISGGITAPPSTSCQLSADPAGLAGAFAFRYELLDYPVGWAVPDGWTADSDGVIFNTDPTPPVFVLPPASLFGKFMPRLTLNYGISPNPLVLPPENLVDTTTAIQVVGASGVKDLGFDEEGQFSATQLWVADHKSNLRILDAVASSPVGPPPLYTRWVDPTVETAPDAPTGSIVSPYATISDAITALGFYGTIYTSGSTTESVDIPAGGEFTIEGLGFAGAPTSTTSSVRIAGTVTLFGGATSLRVRRLYFGSTVTTDGAVALLIADECIFDGEILSTPNLTLNLTRSTALKNVTCLGLSAEDSTLKQQFITIGAGGFRAQRCSFSNSGSPQTISLEGTTALMVECDVDNGNVSAPLHVTFTEGAGVLTVDSYTKGKIAAAGTGFVLTNGTLVVLGDTWTGDEAAAGFKLTGLGAPTAASSDAATALYAEGLVAAEASARNAAIALSQAVAVHDLTHSPVALWQLAGSLADTSGSAIGLTVNSLTQYAELTPLIKGWDGLGGNGFHSTVTSPAALRITGDITIEAIVRQPDNLRGAGSARNIIAFDSNVAGSTGNCLYSIGITTGGFPTWTQQNGAKVTATYTLTTDIFPSGLFHLAVTRTSNVVQIYVNGAPLGAASGALTTPTDGTASNFQFGSQGGAPLAVMLASLKVIASALTAAQVKAEYNRTLGPACGLRP
jgi:hypothetical protein